MPVLSETALQRTSLREQALALLREAVITGRIADGVVYSSKALATELGVSNGPIREAMLALVDDGLMEAVPNKGFRTVPLTAADLAEIYEMRLLLEVPAVARLARGDLPDDRAARLTGLAGTIERTARNRDLTGNLTADGRLITSADEHRPLLTAIMRHDEHTAERLMRRHLEHIRQDWSRPANHSRPADAETDDLHSGTPPDPPAARRA